MPTYRAPAKINLTLEILSRRDDGYHQIRSVMVPIGRYDTLRIETAAATTLTVDTRALGGPIPGVGGEDDLVLRALRALDVPGFRRIALEKRFRSAAASEADPATLRRSYAPRWREAWGR